MSIGYCAICEKNIYNKKTAGFPSSLQVIGKLEKPLFMRFVVSVIRFTFDNRKLRYYRKAGAQGYYDAKCIDMNYGADVTELARCIPARQDGGVGHHKGEKSGVLELSAPRPVMTPQKEKVRSQGRRMKNPGDPMFTITVTDRHGVVYNGMIRKLMPIECWRLQGFKDSQFCKALNAGISKAQLYKQAGNAVTTNVIEMLGRFIRAIDKEEYKDMPNHVRNLIMLSGEVRY